ncbi:hypothetical protein DMUE_4683 [Dictyocoela muelleri]|nr:hypothetical protein DMUE_4683 [Dictyocoela muelleri]
MKPKKNHNFDNNIIGNINSLGDYYVRLSRNKQTPPNKHEDDILPYYIIVIMVKDFSKLILVNMMKKRILIFYRTESLMLANRTNCILSDYTFKTAPKVFHQIFVVHIMFFKKQIPILYAFMKNKNYESYNFILKHLSEKINNFKGFIVSDFEITLANALKTTSLMRYYPAVIFFFSNILEKDSRIKLRISL